MVCKRLDQSEAELETLGTAIKVFGPWPTALNAVKAFFSGKTMHSFRIIDWQKKSRQKISTPPALSSCTHVIFEKSESPKKDFFANQ